MGKRAYDEHMDASITNEFATAGFRLHGLVKPTVPRLNCDDFTEEADVLLRKSFFRPQNIINRKVICFFKYLLRELMMLHNWE